MNGGDALADVLVRQGVRFLFTLCGGHISPILVSAKRRGVRVVDTRHEVDAVFAADAVARLSGVPGVAAVTAGPGATNTITAVKNAQLAQSPLVLLGGATATILKGRGSLQDIDQMALFRPHVKWATSARRVRDLAPTLARAFAVARAGVPGPVFVECPVDLLYDESIVREWYGAKGGGGAKGARSLSERALGWYLGRHLERVFASGASPASAPATPASAEPPADAVRRAASALARAERPVLVVGSQAMLEPYAIGALVAAVERLGVPTYLSGMARGLLGARHALLVRHRRKEALREADVVLLAGVPCDFRLDYGRHIARRATLIAANRSRADLRKNRRPAIAALCDAGRFLRALAAAGQGGADRFATRCETLRARDAERELEIDAMARERGELINPVQLLRELDRALDDDSILVADGGDFVATASYVTAPRAPLCWLDPGAFGTLGVGGGFALGAKLARPSAEVWIVYGDGSVAYSLAEFDTFARHGIGVIALVGNDAGWRQIARDQVEILKDDVGTVLRRSDYHRVAEGYGGLGLALERPADVPAVFARAKAAAREGVPVLINAQIDVTEFRKGSISM